MKDFSITWCGSICILYPLTDPAHAWADEHILTEDTLLWGEEGIVVELRFADDIIRGIHDAGMNVVDGGVA